MSNQQPSPNAPPPTQVPDQRFDAMQRQIRELAEQNQQLRGQVDYMAKVSQPGQQQNAPQPFFKPEVDQAIQQKFQTLIAPIEQKYTQAMGMMRDENDQLKFEARYKNSRYAEYASRVEEEAMRLQRNGQWASREEILKHIYFNETGKKPAAPAPQANTPVPPKYDSYTGQWLDPVTNQPVNPPQYATALPNQPPQGYQDPAQAQPEQQVQPAQVPQPFHAPPSGYQPQPQQQQWIPQLPNSTPPPPASAATTNGSVPTNLGLTSTDQQLGSWADKYGDLPL